MEMQCKETQNYSNISYEKWDVLRRTKWFNAIHDHWDSYIGPETIAGWNPHTGKCWIGNS